MRKNVIAKALQTIGLIPLLVACQSWNQASSSNLKSAKTDPASISDTKNEAKSENTQVANPKYPNSDMAKAAENITTALKAALAEDPKNEPFIQKVLTQPPKIDQIVEACSIKAANRKEYRTDIRSARLFRVSDEKAVLYISCYFGPYRGGGVLFLVSKFDGMQPQPLPLTRLTGYRSGRLKEIEATDPDGKATTGYFGFNEQTKKLSLLYRCDGLWSCFSSASYMFENNKFVLQEYIFGERKLTGDIRYTTQQFIRSKNGWLSSGLMRCSGTTLKNCTKVGAQ